MRDLLAYLLLWLTSHARAVTSYSPVEVGSLTDSTNLDGAKGAVPLLVIEPTTSA